MREWWVRVTGEVLDEWIVRVAGEVLSEWGGSDWCGAL